jgi:hypothetical protein
LNADEPFGDLATNRPGASVRARADRQLNAMRSRSRFGTAIARVFDVKTDERAWRKGVEGEEAVGLLLERRSKDGWQVLHSLPIGDNGGDIRSEWALSVDAGCLGGRDCCRHQCSNPISPPPPEQSVHEQSDESQCPESGTYPAQGAIPLKPRSTVRPLVN